MKLQVAVDNQFNEEQREEKPRDNTENRLIGRDKVGIGTKQTVISVLLLFGWITYRWRDPEFSRINCYYIKVLN